MRWIGALLLVTAVAAGDEFDDAALDGPDPATWIVRRGMDRLDGKDGATPRSRHAVGLALQWLAAHQDAYGRFDCDGFMKHDPEDDRWGGAGDAAYDVGVTGLALLAFLGNGHSFRGSEADDVHVKTVEKAVRFLLRAQAKDGRLGGDGRAAVYEHAIAEAALAEAYGAVRHPHVRAAAQRALDALAAARDPGRGWRYAAGSGECDTSVTAWCVHALHVGRLSGLTVDEEAFAGALAWVELMTDPGTGRTGYNTVGGPSWWHPETGDRGGPWSWPGGEERFEAMAAAGYCIRLFAGEDPRRSKPMKAAAKVFAEARPAWRPGDAVLDPYAWFWTSTALRRQGGTPWRKWNDALHEALIASQHPRGSGSRTGSWEPVGPWARECGRLGTTALLALSLATWRLP